MHTHETRLDALRKQLVKDGLDGFVIPISDEHMSEYVGTYAQRLEWLTGFGGSAGTAVVLADEAAIFVDGRYTLQVCDQVDGKLWSYQSVPQTSVAAWLGEHAPKGAKIGYDAWLHGKGWAEEAAKALQVRGATLVPVSANPVDAVWQDQPMPSLAPAVPHADEHAGKSAHEKRAEVAEWLGAKGLDAAVVSALDSVAWLLNIRGADVDRTPVALSYVIAHADGTADLFIAPEKVTPELTAHLGNAVRVQPREAFVPTLEQLKGRKVAVDPERAVAAIFHALEGAGAEVVAVTDPVVLPKAIKNPVEQAGHRAAQARDGAAIVRFLRWVSVEAPKGGVTELSAADRLPTDITRTVWVGPDAPPAEVKDRFTRVLKGHIALARAVFPKGTAGSQLDSFARQFLWSAGLDYAHGTGHGVGSFLAVHEGPQRIAKASGGQAGTGQELLPGMILSNEPGYYKTGEYGIRIENLVLVERRDIAGAEGEFYGFETLTFAPIARDLVDMALLSAEERDWLNSYHTKVRSVLAPQLSDDDLAWLDAACAVL
ncbi:MAG: X-Pro aminopeptidase [Novosphingobium sp. 16-62-11]|nr:MAG: X-Pro aminopeptidase [Novosphingobium sp. 16-62-11]